MQRPRIASSKGNPIPAEIEAIKPEECTEPGDFKENAEERCQVKSKVEKPRVSRSDKPRKAKTKTCGICLLGRDAGSEEDGQHEGLKEPNGDKRVIQTRPIPFH